MGNKLSRIAITHDLVTEEFLGHKRYYIFNTEFDYQLKVNEMQYIFYKELFSLALDKQENIEDIVNKMSSKYCKSTIEAGINYLFERMLKVEKEGKFSELSQFGKVICNFNYSFDYSKSIYRKIIFVVERFITFLLFSSLIIIVVNHYKIVEYLNAVVSKVIDKNYMMSIMLIIYLFVFVSVLIHEVGHFYVALKYKVPIKNVRIILRYYIVPVIYIEYNNLYRVPIKNRLLIILGGCYFNAVVSIFCFSIFLITSHDIWIIISIINSGMIIQNLFFYDISDGYYLFITVLGVEGLRLDAYKFLADILKGRTNKIDGNKKIIYILVLLSRFFFLFISSRVIYHIAVGLLNLSVYYTWIFMILFCILWVYIYLQKIKKYF